MNITGFLISAILLTLMPGPDILMVITQSVVRGARSGILFTAGLCSGLIVHIALVAFGVATIITESELLFTIIKIFGALYLAFLGVLSFINRKKAVLGEALQSQQGSSPKIVNSYTKGIVMNLLNPKVLLFFIALLPQFVSVTPNESTAQKFLILGLLFMLQAFVIFSTIALLAGRFNHIIKSKPNIGYIAAICESVILIGLGVGLILS